jgi:predicted nucleic acid-binding protein
VTVLADTSVWVNHWRRGIAAFGKLLSADTVAVHPFVIGELALGALHPRAQVLADLAKLRALPIAEHREVLELVERKNLAGSGIGWVDAHLLASAILGAARLWTLDRRMARVAERLGIAFPT